MAPAVRRRRALRMADARMPRGRVNEVPVDEVPVDEVPAETGSSFGREPRPRSAERIGTSLGSDRNAKNETGASRERRGRTPSRERDREPVCLAACPRWGSAPCPAAGSAESWSVDASGDVVDRALIG